MRMRKCDFSGCEKRRSAVPRSVSSGLDKGSKSVEIFDLVGDGCGFLEHLGNGTVLGFGKMYGVFHRLAVDLTPDAIDQVNPGENGGRLGGTFASGAYFETREGLALLAKDGNDVGSSATAKGYEDEFHRAVG